MTDDKVAIITFQELHKKLNNLNFFCGKEISRVFFDDREITPIATDLNIEFTWSPIPQWEDIEPGIEIESEKLMNTIFHGFDIKGNEDLIIITSDSYLENKIFTLKYKDLLEFSNNYGQYLIENIDFVQCFDYIFFLTNQKTIVMIHHEGVFTQIKFDCSQSN